MACGILSCAVESPQVPIRQLYGLSQALFHNSSCRYGFLLTKIESFLSRQEMLKFSSLGSRNAGQNQSYKLKGEEGFCGHIKAFLAFL